MTVFGFSFFKYLPLTIDKQLHAIIFIMNVIILIYKKPRQSSQQQNQLNRTLSYYSEQKQLKNFTMKVRSNGKNTEQYLDEHCDGVENEINKALIFWNYILISESNAWSIHDEKIAYKNQLFTTS